MAKTQKKTDKTSPVFSTRRKIQLLLLIILLAISFVLYVFFRHSLSGYSEDGKWIFIPENATEQAVRDSIMTLGDDAGKATINVIAAIGDIKNVKVGAYQVKHGDKPINIARRLLNGQQTPVRVTFNNIRTMNQLAQRISARMAFTSDDFMGACDTILPKSGLRREQFPAAFIPDSYEFYWTANPAKVVNTLLSFRNNFWTEARLSQAAQLGLTPADVAVIASIVEEESAKKDERPTIARLYLNRLKKNMPLQADPTVKFAVGDFSLKRITNKHLQKRSPYNTYLNLGLPPGPIRIPEKTTLEAVLTCPENNYLYMCAKEDFSGYHNFTSSYDTHLSNARRYQAALDKRGIK